MAASEAEVLVSLMEPIWMPLGSKTGRHPALVSSKRKMNNIADRAKRDPSNLLTIGRTIMANDRTMLAFLRTSLAFFAAGIGLIKYLDHPAYDVIGVVFIALAISFFFWGIHRYRDVKKTLKAVTPSDQQAAEKEIGL